MQVIDVCNLGLAEVGGRYLIGSLTDVTPQTQAANLFYTPNTQMMLRAAPWDFCRAQATLTVWKQAIDPNTGDFTTNPPPQPWLFSYLYPADCVKAHFVLPTIPTPTPGVPLTTAPNLVPWGQPVPVGIPFVVAADADTNGVPVKVILTNLYQAQLIYTRDLSQTPDMWDPLFLAAIRSFLGAYFINFLARDRAQYAEQIAATKSSLDQARISNGNEGIGSVDREPDWFRARRGGACNWAWNNSGAGYLGNIAIPWDSVVFPNGLRY